MFLEASRILRSRETGLIDGMREQVPPNIFVLVDFVDLKGAFPRQDAAVSPFGIATNIEVRYQTPGIAECDGGLSGI